jgi:alpha/beta superfamily hydrolase
MQEEKIFISSKGIQLEGLLSTQEAFPVKGGLVFCHPHPQYGGDMHNAVVATAVGAAFQKGFTTLRFNFRGVGGSEGSYEEGIGEQEDVRAAVEYLISTLKAPGSVLIVGGYSFGAMMSLPIAVRDDRIRGVVAVAPPLEMHDFGFLKGYRRKKLIIAGDQDLFCPVPSLEKWYEGLDEPKSLAIIKGADHFFFRHTRDLIEPLQQFFKAFP